MNNERNIKQAIDEMLKSYRLDSKLLEVKLVNSWEKVMGAMVSKHTTEIFISNRNLFVRLDSAALRQELSYSKEKIVKLMNDEAGGSVIDQVILQ
ncbi:MAG: DUF721 domain-containing protein [Bacteroidia bacterium]|nr:DUF721 domain-containing protein [Bacteroidia bacterium]